MDLLFQTDTELQDRHFVCGNSKQKLSQNERVRRQKVEDSSLHMRDSQFCNAHEAFEDPSVWQDRGSLQSFNRSQWDSEGL